jgi:hypothetical protein
MPLFRRFGRPGLLGAVARTAVVAGTATMTARAINRGMDNRARTQAEADQYEAEQNGAAQDYPAQAHTAQTQPVAPVESITSQLATLSSLKASGAISDDEFARAKQQVLGG